MGFHVACKGAELLAQLSEDANRFLGEPYAFYVIALATSVDEEALEWLIKHEMALDSLTGPYAAFMLFYNEARFTGKPWPPFIRHHLPCNQGCNEREVPAGILRQGAYAVDQALRYDYTLHTSSDILIKSMTYESDAVARHLGLTGELPCLVLFDDLTAADFYVIPLNSELDQGLHILRSIIGKYISRNKRHPFLSTLAQWHAKKEETEELRRKVDRLKEEYRNAVRCDPAKFANAVAMLEPLLREGRAKQYRKELNALGRSGNDSLLWRNIRLLTNEVGVAASLARRIEQATQGGNAKEAEWLPHLMQRTALLSRDNNLAPVSFDIFILAGATLSSQVNSTASQPSVQVPWERI